MAFWKSLSCCIFPNNTLRYQYNFCLSKGHYPGTNPAVWYLSNRKSIETRGKLICTRGRNPRLLIKLPIVLMFFLFCIIVKHKNTLPVVAIWNPRKVTCEQASEYDMSVAFPFSAVKLSKPKQKWANQWACSGVSVTNTCTPVNALCIFMYTI
jgi:hypothetical protein